MTIQQLADNLKKIREFKGLTPYQVHKDTGIQPNVLKNIESGNGYSMKTFLKLCEYLNIEFTINIDLRSLKS